MSLLIKSEIIVILIILDAISIINKLKISFFK